jgi:hypothetical protein
VRRVLSEADVPYQMPWRLACPNPRVISARDATRMLKEASEALGGKMSAREYREFAQTRVTPDGQPWPWSQETLVRAVGVRTWNEALRKVGLPVALDTAGRPAKSVKPCLRVIRQLQERLGRSPIQREYNEVAGDQGLIRSTALRKRFDLRWQKVLDAAAGS